MRRIITIFILCIVAIGVCSAAGDKIEQQRAIIDNLQKQVAAGEREIANLRKSRAANEAKAQSLARQVEVRNRLLTEQRKEEVLLRAQISERNLNVSKLSTQLDVERTEYAKMVREAYRSYSNQTILAYLFSAEDFKDMARRVSNLRAISQLREQRIERIDSLSKVLLGEREVLEERKGALDVVVRDLTNQRSRLQSDVNSAKANVNAMSAKERKVLQQKELQQRQLGDAIKELQKLIKGNQMGASFNGKLTRLPLPVVGGRVKQYKDNMAEVVGAKGAKIISIYEGKVVDIKRNRITGKYDIYIAHGEYITSYAGLYSVSVAKDQLVVRGGEIGVIGEAVDIITMASEHKIVFGVYPPSTKERISASNLFKR